MKGKWSVCKLCYYSIFHFHFHGLIATWRRKGASRTRMRMRSLFCCYLGECIVLLFLPEESKLAFWSLRLFHGKSEMNMEISRFCHHVLVSRYGRIESRITNNFPSSTNLPLLDKLNSISPFLGSTTTDSISFSFYFFTTSEIWRSRREKGSTPQFQLKVESRRIEIKPFYFYDFFIAFLLLFEENTKHVFPHFKPNSGSWTLKFLDSFFTHFSAELSGFIPSFDPVRKVQKIRIRILLFGLTSGYGLTLGEIKTNKRWQKKPLNLEHEELKKIVVQCTFLEESSKTCFCKPCFSSVSVLLVCISEIELNPVKAK